MNNSSSTFDPIELPVDRRRYPGLPIMRSTVETFTFGMVAPFTGNNSKSGHFTTPLIAAALCAAVERHTGQIEFEIGVLMDGMHKNGNVYALPVRVDMTDTLHSFAASIARTVERGLNDDLISELRLFFHDRSLNRRIDSSHALILHGAEMLIWCDGTTVGLDYDGRLFEDSTAKTFLGDMMSLLKDAIAHPEAPIHLLRIVDRPMGLHEWSLPKPSKWLAPELDEHDTVVSRLRLASSLFPQRTAVVGANRRLTYRQLDLLTDHTAQMLVDSGAPNTVGLLCEHDIDCVVAIWATLKAGAAYVPGDPRQPDARLAAIYANAGIEVLLCDEDLLDRGRILTSNISLTVPQELPFNVTHNSTDPTPDSLAYLLYTSGSTGSPKAVMQSHRSVVEHSVIYANQVRMEGKDRIPLLSRYTFDAGIMDIFGTVVTASELHIIDPLQTDGSSLVDRFAACKPTILHCTPTLFRVLLDIIPSNLLSSVRVVFLGGEEVKQDDLKGFYRKFSPTAELVNALGPTECSVALQHVATSLDLHRSTIPVGHPVPGIAIQLTDNEGRNRELIGELTLITNRIALGYWDNQKATEAAFGVTPEGIKCYRTGDVVRRLADGSLVYVGRTDRQVKIRGHRVELAEPEALLHAHPTVAQAVVVVESRQVGQEILVGYVTSATSVSADGEELVEYLGRYLPEYAVPHAIVPLSTLPIGPTGKIDQNALLLAVQKAEQLEISQSILEKLVVDWFSSILGIQDVGRLDDFFLLGGDSLQLMLLLNLVEEEIGITVLLRDFIVDPTPAALAQYLESASQD